MKENPADVEEDSSKTHNGPAPSKGEGEGPDHRQQQTDDHPNPPATPSRKEEDNEFILDGFDFSTGLSICQALDLDEDEGNDAEVAKGRPVLTPNTAKDPSELGNALMKALGVGKEQESAEPKSPHQHPTTLSTGEL